MSPFCQPPPPAVARGRESPAERRQNLLLGGECSRCCCFSCPYHCARCCLLPRSHPLPLRCIACLPSIIIIGAHTNLAHYYESHAPPPGHFPTPLYVQLSAQRSAWTSELSEQHKHRHQHRHQRQYSSHCLCQLQWRTYLSVGGYPPTHTHPAVASTQALAASTAAPGSRRAPAAATTSTDQHQ